MKLLSTLVVVAGLAAGVTGTTFAAVLPGPLVTPEWLAAHRSEVVVLDVRENPDEFTTAPQYTTDSQTGRRTLLEVGGHIPGALLLKFADLRNTRLLDGREIRWMLPDADQFQALMRAAGVPSGRPIVIVTQSVEPEDLDTAARAYWSIKYYGGDELAILDGGTARWLEEGRDVESTSPSPAGMARGDWSAGGPRISLVADSAQVARAPDTGVQLIDARPVAYFFGLVKKPAVAAAGHIRGAIDFPAELHGRPVQQSQRFLSTSEYRSIFDAIGVRADQPLIAYCNTGHMAAGAWFIASELLGNHAAAIYDGSMARWTAEGRPVVAVH
jgi:thiosulfate/3-mercaptopyruvate sulfurtransferase